MHIPNSDDLLFVFVMLSYVCYVALLCIFIHLIIDLIIFDDSETTSLRIPSTYI